MHGPGHLAEAQRALGQPARVAAHEPRRRQLPAVAERGDVVGHDRERGAGVIEAAAHPRRRVEAGPLERVEQLCLDGRAALDAAVELEHVGIVDDGGRVGLVEPRRPGAGAGALDSGQGEQAAERGRVAESIRSAAIERDEVHGGATVGELDLDEPELELVVLVDERGERRADCLMAGRGKPPPSGDQLEQPAGCEPAEEAHVTLRLGEGREAPTHGFPSAGSGAIATTCAPPGGRPT